MPLDIMNMTDRIMDSFEYGAEKKRKEKGRTLMGLAMQGNKNAAQQLYSVDPAAAQQVQTQQKAMHAEVANLMWRGATAIKQAPPERKAQIYAAVRAEVAKHPQSAEWTAMLPEQYDPAQVDPAVDQLLAQTGLYQDTAKANELPAQLQVIDGLMERAGYAKGSPEYLKAVQIFANMEPKARAQIVQDAGGGYQVATFGGGNAPTASQVTSGVTTPAPTREMPYPKATDENQQIALEALRRNPEFSNLSDADLLKVQQAIQDDTPFNIQAGKVVASESSGLRQPAQGNQLMGPAKGSSASEESFGQPQNMIGPDGMRGMYQVGNRGTVRKMAGFNAVAPPRAAKSGEETVDAKKTAGFLARMENAEKEISRVESSGYKPGGIVDNYTAAQGLANYWASPKGQEYRQAQENWVRANLRLESGAAIPDSEMEKEISNYFPQPGDGKEVIEQKKRNRQVTQDALRKRAGGGVSNAPTEADANMTIPPLDGSGTPKRLKFNPTTGKIE